jgi:bacterioferritin
MDTRVKDGELRLDEAAIERARQDLDAGAVTPSSGPWHTSIVKLLNDALATEIVCVLRYRRHYYTATGMASPAVAAEFLEHSNEELAHADRLAERIVQLGGEPQFDPANAKARSHAQYDEPTTLVEMVRSNLVAERVAIETYRQMIQLIGDKDPTSRRLLEEVLEAEEEHADDMKDLLGG